MFANNSLVAFGDVNLQTDPIGGPYQAGAGGWPTVRIFNKESGVGGRPYQKKTSKAMCEELGDDKYMNELVLEAGSTSLCDIATSAECTPKELEFLEKWKSKPAEELTAQIERLRTMAASSMKPELRTWLGQRLNVLASLQVAALSPVKEEL